MLLMLNDSDIMRFCQSPLIYLCTPSPSLPPLYLWYILKTLSFKNLACSENLRNFWKWITSPGWKNKNSIGYLFLPLNNPLKFFEKCVKWLQCNECAVEKNKFPLNMISFWSFFFISENSSKEIFWWFSYGVRVNMTRNVLSTFFCYFLLLSNLVT